MTTFLYRNLRTGLWQLGERPVASAAWPRHREVLLAGVTFRRSERSWERCLRNAQTPGTKQGWEVHAFAVGTVLAAGDTVEAPAGEQRVPVTYDKWGTGKFVRKDTNAPLAYCELIHFRADGHADAIGQIEEELP